MFILWLSVSFNVVLFGSSKIGGNKKVSYKKNAGTIENTPKSPIKTTGSISKKFATSTTKGAKTAP